MREIHWVDWNWWSRRKKTAISSSPLMNTTIVCTLRQWKESLSIPFPALNVFFTSWINEDFRIAMFSWQGHQPIGTIGKNGDRPVQLSFPDHVAVLWGLSNHVIWLLNNRTQALSRWSSHPCLRMWRKRLPSIGPSNGRNSLVDLD